MNKLKIDDVLHSVVLKQACVMPIMRMSENICQLWQIKGNCMQSSNLLGIIKKLDHLLHAASTLKRMEILDIIGMRTCIQSKCMEMEFRMQVK